MTETPTQTAKPVKRRAVPDIVRDFAAFVEAIPEADDTDGGLQIAGRILDAQSPEQLNAIAELPDGRDVAGRILVVHSVSRRKSDYDGGLGWYLDVESVDASTGELVRFQTGATSVVAALAKAHHEGWLPLKVQIEAGHTTKAGFTPLNLHVYGSGADAF